MESRYVDAFPEINRYETMFYATNDLENIGNIPQFLDGLSPDKVLQNINELSKVYLSSKNEKITEKFSGVKNLNIVENSFSFSAVFQEMSIACLLYTSPSPRDWTISRMPSSA